MATLAAPAATQVGLEIHGLRILVAGDWPEVIEEIRLDFAWFVTSPPAPAAADVTIAIERRAPDFDAFGDLPAAFVTPRNVVYEQDGRSVIDYFGEAVSIYDRERGELRVQGEHKPLVHQAVYLFVLSRIGEHLEQVGLARLHALGMVGAQGAVAVMLPSGGGKSTLALQALRAGDVKLLSEDSPLVDRRGMLHPFPLRLGINPTDAATLPDGKVRTIERLEFHPKMVLDIESFADRIESRPQPLRHIAVGRRTLGKRAALEPLPRRKVTGTLLRECVVGVGLYQGMEFLLQHGLRDLTGMLRPLEVRTTCCMRALMGAQTWSLTMGRDREENWAALRPLLDP